MNAHYAVLGTRVDATSYSETTARVCEWAVSRRSEYVAVANVHMVMEGVDCAIYRKLINGAGIVTPDGMPLVWMLRRMGRRNQERVYGPTLMLHICEAAAVAGIPVGLYGGRREVLDRLGMRLRRRFPELKVACAMSPPFRPLSLEEDARDVDEINASGTRILFVGLGCPRQEQWMAEHKERVKAVMLGVGAAFDFHAGAVKQSPAWLQRIGLEWAFRLLVEPRRLWRRYLTHNPRFLYLASRQLMNVESKH
jgi:N-acetylglucosaminyldiphosphoundecaprenol N-acetyl-beta-D-mannosaminyltransferase